MGEYEWAFIQNRTEREVAAILRDSLILVFLSTTEGFGILPVEAMLCGSIVLGYRHGPLIEYLRPGNSYVSEAHDVLSVVRNLEEVTALFLEDPERLRAVSDAAQDGRGVFVRKGGRQHFGFLEGDTARGMTAFRFEGKASSPPCGWSSGDTIRISGFSLTRGGRSCRAGGMARLARVVVPGVAHHVTQRGNRRQQTFFQEDDYALSWPCWANGAAVVGSRCGPIA